MFGSGKITRPPLESLITGEKCRFSSLKCADKSNSFNQKVAEARTKAGDKFIDISSKDKDEDAVLTLAELQALLNGDISRA